MNTTRFLHPLVVLGSSAASAQTKLPPASLPVVGEHLAVTGNPTWIKRDWLYDVPSATDAAGKIVIHWFCGPKVKTCVDDLARVVTLKENQRVYIVAYINGNKAQAKKLDPIRESEGVGRGTLAFGKGATTIMKQMGITGPASVVVDVDGKVVLVTSGALPAELDARDAKVNTLASAIKDYTKTSSEAPKGLKPDEKFTLSMTVKLAPWIRSSAKTQTEFTPTVPPDFKCGPVEVLQETQQLTAKLTCTAPRGAYEARGELRFGYQDATGGAGLGTESARWTFDVKP